MMITRLILVLFLAIGPTAAMSNASTVRDRIVAELRADGFDEIRVTRTFLGRIRFVGSDRERRREIVVTKTGVILRDYVRFVRNADSDSSDSKHDSEDGDDDNNYDDGDDDDNGGENDDDESDDDESDDDDDSSGSDSGSDDDD